MQSDSSRIATITEITRGSEGREQRTARVLVVDDEPSVREMLEEMLTGGSYATRSAAGIDEAIRELQSYDFDAVILDIFLGESESGLDLLSTIKQYQPYTPAVVISGMANTDDVITALKAGAYDLLCKPFNLAEVMKAVANAVEKKRISEENARLVDELRSERDQLEVRVDLATRDLAAKVETLRTLNEQLSTIFEMSQERSISGSPQAILDHIITILRKIFVFEGAFCMLFDLRAKQFNLTFSSSEKAREMGERITQLFVERHEELTHLMEDSAVTASKADLKKAMLGLLPATWDSDHSLLIPLYAPGTLLGAFGVIEIAQPSNLTESEERILSFAISHFLTVFERRKFANRTTQLASFGELVSEIAHDLRHPMTSLGGAAKILERKWNEEEKRNRCLSQISTDLSRMKSLVTELVNFDEPRDMSMVSVDVHEIVEKAIEVCGSLLEEARIQAVRQYRAEPSTILGLSKNMMEAFVNLITNAIRAMEPGGILTVSTGTELSPEEADWLREQGRNAEECLSIAFQDTGRGMSEEELVRIFKRFYTTSPEGMGLGLSAVNRIVRQNLGAVRVRSEVGTGSTFTIYLPKA